MGVGFGKVCEFPTPRGRWSIGRFVRMIGKDTSTQAHLYEIITPGSGVVEYTVGDLVVVKRTNEIAASNNGATFIHEDELYAKWNPIAGIPIPLHSTLFGEVRKDRLVATEWTFSDAVAVEVLDVNPSITDILPGDVVLVRRSRLVNAADERSLTQVLFRAEDVLATCPATLGPIAVM